MPPSPALCSERGTGRWRCRRAGSIRSPDPKGSRSSPSVSSLTLLRLWLRLRQIARDPVHHVAVVERNRNHPPAPAAAPVEPDEAPALGPFPHAALAPLREPQALAEIVLGAPHQGDRARIDEGDDRRPTLDDVGAQIETRAIDRIPHADAAVHDLRRLPHRLTRQNLVFGRGERARLSGEITV